jgi:hypothetical protein
MENQGTGIETAPLSQFELGSNLRPVESLDRAGAQKELAAVNLACGDKSQHPYWDETNPAHKQAVERVHRLLGRISLTDEEKAKQAEERKEEVDRKSAEAWEKYEREEGERKIQKAQDQLREKLAREGRSADKQEAGAIIENAQALLGDLEKQGILEPDFRDFLDAVKEGGDPEGDSLDLIHALAIVKGVVGRYGEWKKKAK